MVDIIVGDEQWMKLGEDGTQSHVQGRATPADLYKRLTAGPPRNWSDGFTTEIKAECGGLCVMECKRCKANLTWRAAYPRRTGSPRGQVGCLRRPDTSTEEGRGQRLQEPTLKTLPPSQTTFATSGCPRQRSSSLCWL